MSTESYPLGKFDEESLENYVFPHLGKKCALEYGPRFGSDFNAIELPEKMVLAISTDPLAVSPELGWERSGKLALQVISTDVAVSGIPPSYLVANWNLPPETSNQTFERIWLGFTEEAKRNDISIIGGHTGRYSDSSFPVVGAATALGIGRRDQLLSGGLASGDWIFVLNRLGLEAAAIFSFYYPDKLSRLVSREILFEVKQEFDDITPTGDLSFLASLPGVKALHDIAEGGLMGGLRELLSGKDRGARIEKSKISAKQNVARICRELNLNPLKITSIGSGIGVVSPESDEEFLAEAHAEGLPVEMIGKVKGEKGITLETEKGEKTLTGPIHDGFWDRLSEFGRDRGNSGT